MMIVLRWHLYAWVCVVLILSGCEDKSHTHAQYPAMNTAAFSSFFKQCADCHMPPLPSQHKAQEWPMVVVRMMRHRAEHGLAPIPPQEQLEILTYLQHYAAERT